MLYLKYRSGVNHELLPKTVQVRPLHLRPGDKRLPRAVKRFDVAHLRRRLDEKFTDRMLLAEANQWPEDAVAYVLKELQ